MSRPVQLLSNALRRLAATMDPWRARDRPANGADARRADWITVRGDLVSGLVVARPRSRDTPDERP